MLLSNIKKEYPNSVKLLKYRRHFELSPPKCVPHFLIACQTCWPRNSRDSVSDSSLLRSKSVLSDLCLANDFDMFATFTYDPKKVNSFSYSDAKSKMSNWLNNQKKPHKSPDLAYIVVAELHKSGAIHFHALLKNYGGDITYWKMKNGRKMYNLDEWGWGYSTVVKIDNLLAVSRYIKKYIQKDMLKVSNKKRYWRSKNLIMPEKTYNVDLYTEMYSTPLFIVDKYHTDYFSIYTIQK